MGTDYEIISHNGVTLEVSEQSNTFEIVMWVKNHSRTESLAAEIRIGSPDLSTDELGEVICEMGYAFGIWATESEMRRFEEAFLQRLYDGSTLKPRVLPKQVNSHLSRLTPEQRREFMHEAWEGYCPECGDQLRLVEGVKEVRYKECFCTRDE